MIMENINLILDETSYQTFPTHAYKKMLNRKKHEHKNLTAIIPGTVIEIFVCEGQIVKEGDLMLIIEAMKMNNRIVFNIGGEIQKIHVKPCDVVAKDQLLVTLK